MPTDINFRTRKWVRPEDLNANETLFGGSVLRWVDEEAAIYAILQLGNHRVVTKYISSVEFVSSARLGDLVELGLTATKFGRGLAPTSQVRANVSRWVDTSTTRSQALRSTRCCAASPT